MKARAQFLLDEQEVLTHLGCGLISLRTILLKGLGDDLVQSPGDGRPQFTCRRWSVVKDRLTNNRGGFSRESSASGCHLVQNQSERKQIRASI
jgi:hypothetical protein